MRYLIDGHNLIGRLPDLSLADPYDEMKLVQLLARWRWRHSNPPVTVVFDPGDSPVHGAQRQTQSGIMVRYAPFGSSADAVLKRLIETTRQPAQITVVSSDREIQSAARRAGACAMPAEEFAGELTAPATPQEDLSRDEPLSPQEVETWLRVFREHDDTLSNQ